MDVSSGISARATLSIASKDRNLAGGHGAPMGCPESSSENVPPSGSSSTSGHSLEEDGSASDAPASDHDV